MVSTVILGILVVPAVALRLGNDAEALGWLAFPDATLVGVAVAAVG